MNHKDWTRLAQTEQIGAEFCSNFGIFLYWNVWIKFSNVVTWVCSGRAWARPNTILSNQRVRVPYCVSLFIWQQNFSSRAFLMMPLWSQLLSKKSMTMTRIKERSRARAKTTKTNPKCIQYEHKCAHTMEETTFIRILVLSRSIESLYLSYIIPWSHSLSKIRLSRNILHWRMSISGEPKLAVRMSWVQRKNWSRPSTEIWLEIWPVALFPMCILVRN